MVEYSLYHISPIAHLSKKIMKFLHPVILMLGFTGIFFLINEVRQKQIENLFFKTPCIIFVIIIYYTFLYSIFVSLPRYSVPLRPELYLFSIYSFVKLKNFFNQLYVQKKENKGKKKKR